MKNSKKDKPASDELLTKIQELEHKIQELEQERTQRRKSENSLQERVERQALLLDAVGEGLLGLDDQGMFTYVNNAALEMLGYGEEELQGRSIHELIHPTRKDGSGNVSDACPVCQCLAAGTGSFAATDIFQKKDGSFLPIQYVCKAISKEKNRLATVLSFRDISEKLSAEKKIRESEENFQFALAAARAFFWWYDIREDRLEYSSAQLFQDYGYTSEEVPKTLEALLVYVHPDDRMVIREAVAAHLSGKTFEFKIDYRVFNKTTDTYCWFHSVSRFVFWDENGQGIRAVGMTTDINERQKLLEEIRESQETHLFILDAVNAFYWQSFPQKNLIQYESLRYCSDTTPGWALRKRIYRKRWRSIWRISIPLTGRSSWPNRNSFFKGKYR